jgi:hypothetical protein
MASLVGVALRRQGAVRCYTCKSVAEGLLGNWQLRAAERFGPRLRRVSMHSRHDIA